MIRDEIQCAEDACRIRDRMSSVRSRMDREVTGLKKGAGNLLSLQYQMKSHPWIGVGAAAVLGFLLIPRNKSAQKLQLDDKELQKLVERGGIKVEASPGSKVSLLRSATAIVATAGLRAALAYAGQQFGKVQDAASVSDAASN